MKVLIVGGGIAGPVAAMAMQKVGLEARVIEAYPRGDGEIGSYFTITPNGLDALASVSALHCAVESGFSTRRNVMCNAAGKVLGELPLGMPLADGTPALTIKRSRLALSLVEEAERRGIAVDHGRRLTGAFRVGSQIQATYDDGATELADVLVGADGVHSVVRRLIDHEAPDGRYVGLTNFGGITSGGVVPVELEAEAWRFWFGRRAFFGAHPTPDGDVVWFVNAPRPAISEKERATTTNEEWRGKLAALFEDDDSPAASMIRAGRLELAADNTYDLGHVPVWFRDGMIVIGDAAHAPAPSSGQGGVDGPRGCNTPRPVSRECRANGAYDRSRLCGVRGRPTQSGGAHRRPGSAKQQLQDPRSGRQRVPRCHAAPGVSVRGDREVAVVDLRLPSGGTPGG